MLQSGCWVGSKGAGLWPKLERVSRAPRCPLPCPASVGEAALENVGGVAAPRRRTSRSREGSSGLVPRPGPRGEVWRKEPALAGADRRSCDWGARPARLKAPKLPEQTLAASILGIIDALEVWAGEVVLGGFCFFFLGGG